jgi:hypothetical protein
MSKLSYIIKHPATQVISGSAVPMSVATATGLLTTYFGFGDAAASLCAIATGCAPLPVVFSNRFEQALVNLGDKIEARHKAIRYGHDEHSLR